MKADEPLVELETDKVTLEVMRRPPACSPRSRSQSGATVKPGALLGAIGEGAALAQPQAPAKPRQLRPAAQARDRTVAAAAMPPSPAAAKIAADKGIDLAGCRRLRQARPGVEGRCSRRAGRAADGAAPCPRRRCRRLARAGARSRMRAREERVRMTRLRQTIARRLKDAQNTAAMLTTFNEVDMSAVMALRAAHKDAFEKKHGVKLGFMGFFVKACVARAEGDSRPSMPRSTAPTSSTRITITSASPSAPTRASSCRWCAIATGSASPRSRSTIAELGKRARDGALKIEEMQGGTFTITNGGVYGSLMSTPILNAPQSGILGMHKIQERPVAVAGKVEIRPMMYLALTYDHRIVDGKEAVTFLVRVKEALEDPARLVLDL